MVDAQMPRIVYVNLQMRVFRGQVFEAEANVGVFLFFGVQVLYDAVFHQVLP